MGQYWYTVKLDKHEFLNPHTLGAGLKLWEQLANSPGVGEALVILLAAEREVRGGGDFDMDENWHGAERTFPEHNGSPGPMPESYTSVAARVIGRWAGDRIALVGDYGEDSDLAPEFHAGSIYSECNDGGAYLDISPIVAQVIEHELRGKYEGDGWRHFVEGGE